MNVKKRTGELVPFDSSKIAVAVQKAIDEVYAPITGKGYPLGELAKKVADAVEEDACSFHCNGVVGVEDIQDYVEYELMDSGEYSVAQAYIRYRYERELVRKQNETDDHILSIIRNDDSELATENSNKDITLGSTQRDYIAGEVSRDISKRLLLPKDIVKAHENGVLHMHDLDYFMQPLFNCCLVNIQDMLDNGTVINGKMIESPHTFRTACTIMTQIIANIASNQYGGQSVDIRHLGKYLKRSRERFERKLRAEGLAGEDLETTLNMLMKEELSAGVQTIQYQINTLMTTNGQSPFVTLFMNLRDDDPYRDYVAMIIEEILRQRLQGIKNEKGVYITPAFPKLVYVLDENNAHKDSPYWYLTQLAVKCSSKRMYPDYISAKVMRENYEGNVFAPMGCRSFLSPWKNAEGEYIFESRFNQGVVSINLPQIALACQDHPERFWTEFEERLQLCYKALMCRHEHLHDVTSDVSPLHWQHGGIARLGKGESIAPLLHGGFSTISLGYIGLYEVTKLMTGESHTTEKGQKFAIKVMQFLRDHVDQWKKETGIGFALYGTPAESLCYRFAKVDKEKYGEIPDVTDKGYYTNSYHVDVREPISAFAKLKFESQFQKISSGGCISYIEIPNVGVNLTAMEKVVQFMYENIMYAEFNTKSDYCMECGFDGEIIINDDGEWECPQCGNKNHDTMNITRRTCGLK